MDDARRQSLDEFFAQAEDVLTDWAGSPDAMNSAPNACLDFAGALRPPSATEALTLFRVTWADAERRLMADVIHPASNWLIITGI